MLIILSPAKKLNFNDLGNYSDFTENRFLDSAKEIVKALRRLSVEDLGSMMHISPSLAHLNYQRYRDWQLPFTLDNARQALFTFSGDAYGGLDAATFSQDDIQEAQNHLRILSALYGAIRPLDLIQAYRIEMGMKFSWGKNKSLYQFWQQKITKTIADDLKAQGDNILINLASKEYYKVLDKSVLKAQIITPVFKEYKGSVLKIVSSKAKRARGLMSRFIIQNQIKSPEELKLFDSEGYFYMDKLSNENEFLFVKG